MATVSIENCRKSYGSLEVLHGINLDIEEGEFLILVGPSGCGKSTLLRIIAGLEDSTRGSVRIGSEVVNDLPPKDRDIAMVFQSYALYPHMQVAENMSFSLRLRGRSKSEVSERVKKAANILGLSQLLDRLPRHLSGGQRQRVAMGRSIVRDPSVFLFDEPLSNLDAKLRVQMRVEIKTLHQRLKTTTIYVTHDQMEAMTLADRIVVMNGGNVEQIGKPLEVYDRPDNAFVAGFIGSPAMNLFAGEVTEEGFLTGDLRLPVAEPPLGWKGKKAIYGIRPEHLRIAEKGIPAMVKMIEPMGSETQIHLDLGSLEATCLLRDRLPVDVGTMISVAPKMDSIHLFDQDTGKRIN